MSQNPLILESERFECAYLRFFFRCQTLFLFFRDRHIHFEYLLFTIGIKLWIDNTFLH